MILSGFLVIGISVMMSRKNTSVYQDNDDCNL